MYPARAGMGRALGAAAMGEKAISNIIDKTPLLGHAPSTPYAEYDPCADPRESRWEIRYGVKNYGRNGRMLS